MTDPITGFAAGVPFVLVPPTSDPTAETPSVVVWHLLDAPRSEVAMAATLPLAGLDAWRVYLGLPLCGSRSPGQEQFMALGAADAVGNIYGPVSDQAVAETGPALADLRSRFGVGQGMVALVGGSLGAAVAGLVALQSPPAPLVLISPLTQLRPLVDAMGRRFGRKYPWAPESDAVAGRVDLVARAEELAGRPVLLVLGALDDAASVLTPARALHDRLGGSAQAVTVDGMVHALAEEPGVAAAPQTAHAAEVDALVVDWLRGQF